MHGRTKKIAIKQDTLSTLNSSPLGIWMPTFRKCFLQTQKHVL